MQLFLHLGFVLLISCQFKLLDSGTSFQKLVLDNCYLRILDMIRLQRIVKIHHEVGKPNAEILTLFARAKMTLLRFARLLLMFCVSLRRWPCEPDSFSRSLPAKSIRFNIPTPQQLMLLCTRQHRQTTSLCQKSSTHVK